MAEQALRDPQDAIDNYREKTVQCLVLGNYTEPGAYTVETLLLYYISDHGWFLGLLSEPLCGWGTTVTRLTSLKFPFTRGRCNAAFGI
jgi:hypothetical protein